MKRPLDGASQGGHGTSERESRLIRRDEFGPCPAPKGYRSSQKDRGKVAERIRDLRKGARLEGVTIRQLIEEGRRY